MTGLTFSKLAVWALLVGSEPYLLAQTIPRNEDLRVLRGIAIESQYHEMLYSSLLKQAAEQSAKRLARLEAIQSQADFTKWQDVNRHEFLRLIGDLPHDRTPLNPRTVGEVGRDGYTIRKVIFESLPEFYVTANLYVPTTGRGPFPAILSLCGHSENGKAYDAYQRLDIGLAKRGYVVLAYDPIGQGERVQYWDFIHHCNLLQNPDNQHAMAGVQAYLLGHSVARYFIWDGVRAIDYVTSLPEVDTARIGVTGSSGGGTLATYVGMLDPRVKVASIVTFITSIPRKIEARTQDGDGDPEQDIPDLLAAGIDHTEFVGMIAPRPVLIGAATQDFFPIAGSRQTFKEAHELYRKIGYPDRIRMVEFDHPHMYSKPLREATYVWFDRWLKKINGNEAHEPPITVEKDATLECTSTGQVVTSLGGMRLNDFNVAAATRLLDGLQRQRSQPGFRSGLVRKIAERLGSQSGLAEASAQELGESKVDDLVIKKFLLTNEPGIVVPTRLIYLQAAIGGAKLPAIVYLRDRSAENDAELLTYLARQGRIVAVADVRGFGETKSSQNVTDARIDYFDSRDGTDADYTYASFFIGRPLLGMRVRDARGVVEFLRGQTAVDARRISVMGRGWAGLVALFTAACEPDVSSVAVEGVLASYAEVAQAETYELPVSLLLPNVLLDFDLEDVLASLVPRPLLFLNPLDAKTKIMSREQAARAVASALDAYRAAGAGEAFEARVAPFEKDVNADLVNWALRR